MHHLQVFRSLIFVLCHRPSFSRIPHQSTKLITQKSVIKPPVCQKSTRSVFLKTPRRQYAIRPAAPLLV